MISSTSNNIVCSSSKWLQKTVNCKKRGGPPRPPLNPPLILFKWWELKYFRESYKLGYESLSNLDAVLEQFRFMKQSLGLTNQILEWSFFRMLAKLFSWSATSRLVHYQHSVSLHWSTLASLLLAKNSTFPVFIKWHFVTFVFYF